MAKGIIDFMTSDCEEAKLLRKYYIIKIIPMLNPDGVILGNFRTSVAGTDLNRRWDDPSKIIHPEIFNTKQLVISTNQRIGLDLFCDLHGHAGEYNAFIYGNKSDGLMNQCRMFPLIFSKLNKSFFYSLCSFKMQNFKRGTARINIFEEIQIPNVFTLEASMIGTNAVF